MNINGEKSAPESLVLEFGRWFFGRHPHASGFFDNRSTRNLDLVVGVIIGELQNLEAQPAIQFTDATEVQAIHFRQEFHRLVCQSRLFRGQAREFIR